MTSGNQQVMGLRERKKAKTMASIQKHALRLFREQGYNETTVEQIAEAAEISPSTFFRYFATKEEVVVRDNYDPLLVTSFEAQPEEYSPLQAIKNAMCGAVSRFSEEELAAIRERNQLIMGIPELRAALIGNMTQTMELVSGLLAKRSGRSEDDFAVRTMAGAIVGVNISAMMQYAEEPETSFAQLLDEALTSLETGLHL
ncbi:acyl-CoA-like ligand-binding transcription factor [Paenibacillus tuaregi]|uniref:acyl-CoA-like ligand-binding transcription factor n=1 Tax=Paenibacillus tuaregi TaxID=1816681 RepID=UPI000A56320A|nr:TetR family transcriptional regulator [Paenibacillus tuaregi]